MDHSAEKSNLECPSEAAVPSAVVKKPRKSILKKHHEPQDHTQKEATFDEMNILATYHPPDKDYGHMKIDEPKTPYRSDGSDADDLDPEDVTRRLNDFEEGTTERPRYDSSGKSDDDDEQISPEERERKKKFRQHRKEHYNMKEQLKRAKELLAKEMAEDDE